VKITEDDRKYAATNAISGDEAPTKGWATILTDKLNAL
jgi:hypothetical protein